MPAPPPSAPTAPGGPPAWSPVPPPPKPRRGRTALIGLLVAAVVAAAVVVGIWLGSRDDDPGLAADSPSGDASDRDEPTGGEDTGGPDSGDGEAAGIPVNSVVLPVTDGDGDTRIYAIDVDTGDSEALTEGPDDRVPAISPDRSTLIYVEATEGGSGRPMVMNVVTGKTRPLLTAEGGCEFAARPGFNPAGNRVVVICLDEFGGYTATYILNLRGEYVANLPVSGEPMGTPTWTSGNTLVYALAGYPEGEPSTLWEAEVDAIEAQQLTDGSEGWDTHPDWSDEADAGLLLFSRHPGKEIFGDLLTRDAEGEPGPSTSGELWAHPAWSPDGSRVVFTVRDDDGTERLAVAPIDDLSDVSFVPDLPGDPGIPAWGSR